MFWQIFIESFTVMALIVIFGAGLYWLIHRNAR